MNFIHPTTLIDGNVILGERTKVWQFATIREGTKIGEDCVIGSCCYVGRNIILGNGVHLQHGVFLPDGTICEDSVFIGPNCTLTDDRYPRAMNPLYIREPPVLKQGCSLGAGVVVLPGVTVGEFAMVGAGAIVTEDVPANATVVGNPAQIHVWGYY